MLAEMKRPIARRLDQEYDEVVQLMRTRRPPPPPSPAVNPSNGYLPDDRGVIRRFGRSVCAEMLLTAQLSLLLNDPSNSDNQDDDDPRITITGGASGYMAALAKLGVIRHEHPPPVFLFTDQFEPICWKDGNTDEIGESDRGLLNGELITVFSQPFDDWLKACDARDVDAENTWTKLGTYISTN